MELKEINVSDILANFYQPRTKFDKEGIKELAESILSNGLINPITITPDKKRKGKFMIVSGERRWQAHKVAGLKTISAVVKEYSTDGQFMVESLIENIHREDLTPEEKAKFCLSIMKAKNLKSINSLAKELNISESSISSWIDLVEIKKANPKFKNVSASVIYETKTLPEKQRIEVLEKAQREDLGNRAVRQLVSEIKSGERPEPIQLERTANDIIVDILSNLDNFRHNVNELKETNIEDIGKKEASQSMTTAGLHMKTFIDFVNIIRRTGTKPNPLILKLIKEKNGKP